MEKNILLSPFEKASLDILILETIQRADSLSGSYENRTGLAYLIDSLPAIAKEYHNKVVEQWNDRIAENQKILGLE